MHYDAVLAKDSALRELKLREDENKNDRRRRDIEISALRKVAEDKRNETDFSEKKLVCLLWNSTLLLFLQCKLSSLFLSILTLRK